MIDTDKLNIYTEDYYRLSENRIGRGAGLAPTISESLWERSPDISGRTRKQR